MKLKVRNFLDNFYIIHFEVLLGLFALYGYLEINNKYLILFSILSFSGAICGAFSRVMYAIKENSNNSH